MKRLFKPVCPCVLIFSINILAKFGYSSRIIFILERDIPCTYKVTLRHLRLTIIAVEKQ